MEWGANNLPEIELRYGQKVVNGSNKRKRTRDDNVENKSPEAAISQGSTTDEDFLVVCGGPLFRGDENPRKLEGTKTLTGINPESQEQKPPNSQTNNSPKTSQPKEELMRSEEVTSRENPTSEPTYQDQGTGVPEPGPPNKRPRQVLGESLKRRTTSSHASETKEQLQEVCRKLGLKTTGNKPELRGRIQDREREREQANSFFKLTIPGVPKPGITTTTTPVKKPPPRIPITPSVRRKRDDEDPQWNTDTPSKKLNVAVEVEEVTERAKTSQANENKLGDKPPDMGEDNVGRTIEEPREAKTLPESHKGDKRGGQCPENAISIRIIQSKLNYTLNRDKPGSEIKGRTMGRPGEDNETLGRLNKGKGGLTTSDESQIKGEASNPPRVDETIDE